jgi:hypothetical protein
MRAEGGETPREKTPGRLTGRRFIVLIPPPPSFFSMVIADVAHWRADWRHLLVSTSLTRPRNFSASPSPSEVGRDAADRTPYPPFAGHDSPAPIVDEFGQH